MQEESKYWWIIQIWWFIKCNEEAELLKKIFLTSYFAGTSQLFGQYFVSAELEKKVVFIPTAASVDEY